MPYLSLGWMRCFSTKITPIPRLTKLHYGEKVKPLFSLEEYANRVSQIRSKMANEGISASVFTSIHNLTYYANYLYAPMGRIFALVVTQDKTHLVVGNADGGRPYRYGVADEYITYTDTHDDNLYHGIKTAIESSSTNDGKIGIEYDHVDLDAFERLKLSLGNKTFADVSVLSMQQRMIKSKAEQQVQREGVRIGEIGMKACAEAIHENVPEYVVTQHTTNVMVEELARSYPDLGIWDIWTWLQTGSNADSCHQSATTRKIQNGDNMSMMTFPLIQGYYTACERTVFLNHATDAQIDAWNFNLEVHRKGIELAKPGARISDFSKKLNEMYDVRDWSQYRAAGYGHSFGILSWYYGREKGLELREYCDAILEPGMIICIEPYLVLPPDHPGHGTYREHDILIMMEDGTAENTSTLPLGPDHYILKK